MYIGVYSNSGVRVADGVPAIVDKALFRKVEMRLKNKKNPQGRHRENGEYMLTGKLFCGLCGAPMVGISGTGHGKEMHYYYICKTKRTNHSCDKKTVRRDWLERVVVQATLDHVLQPDVIQWIADAVMAYQEREANSSVLIGLREQLSENQRAIKNIMKAIEAGIITASTKNRLEELETEGSRLENAISVEESYLTHVERDFVVFWMEQFRDGNIESAAFRRKVIDSFVNAVYLYDDHIRIAFNFSGKGAAVESELVTDAEAIAGAEGSFKLSNRPPSLHAKKDALNFLDVKTGVFEFFNLKTPVLLSKKLKIFEPIS